jgi:hypothetical protein
VLACSHQEHVAEADISAEITGRIGIFKTCLVDHGIERALNDHVLAHGCSIIGADVEVMLRETIAARFEIDATCVTLVGSAKLGFSPKPGQYFRPFSAASDLDVAIVSKDLFAKVWTEVFEMERAGEYFDYSQFKHYHFKGWVRPDKLPSQQEYETSRAWWEFFKKLSADEAFLRMKIRAGLYFNDYFLRQYQSTALLGMRDQLVMGGQL